MNTEITFHRVKDIYVETGSSGSSNWFSITFIDDNGYQQEISVFGKDTMPEVHFGDPADRHLKAVS